MPDLADMRRAVLASPEDDTVRLVYADALDEAGGEDNATDAEFIRLQIELHHKGLSGSMFAGEMEWAGLPEPDELPAYSRAAWRESRLYFANRERWLCPVCPLCGPARANRGKKKSPIILCDGCGSSGRVDVRHSFPVVRRGFVQSVTISPSEAWRARELCDTCGGSGTVDNSDDDGDIERECHPCGGTGFAGNGGHDPSLRLVAIIAAFPALQRVYVRNRSPYKWGVTDNDHEKNFGWGKPHDGHTPENHESVLPNSLLSVIDEVGKGLYADRRFNNYTLDEAVDVLAASLPVWAKTSRMWGRS